MMATAPITQKLSLFYKTESKGMPESELRPILIDHSLSDIYIYIYTYIYQQQFHRSFKQVQTCTCVYFDIHLIILFY